MIADDWLARAESVPAAGGRTGTAGWPATAERGMRRRSAPATTTYPPLAPAPGDYVVGRVALTAANRVRCAKMQPR